MSLLKMVIVQWTLRLRDLDGLPLGDPLGLSLGDLDRLSEEVSLGLSLGN